MYLIHTGRREDEKTLSFLPSLFMNWAENGFHYKFLQPTSTQVGWKNIY